MPRFRRTTRHPKDTPLLSNSRDPNRVHTYHTCSDIGASDQQSRVPSLTFSSTSEHDTITLGGRRGPQALKELGQDGDGNAIKVLKGRYGPYVTEVLPDPPADAPRTRKTAAVKPRTASLFKDMDLSTIDLETALKLMSLPRIVGAHPETGAEITAQNGRYGPYLKMGTDSRSLETESQLFDITLDEALAIYAQPKTRGRAAAKPPLKELGNDPVSGKPVTVKDGRFGAYVTDGETNATLRRDDDPETITPERGFELLEEKRAKGPTTRRGAKKTTRKSPAKKAPAKKTTRKAPAKK